MSTYHPQPVTKSPPSRSQLNGVDPMWALHVATITTPAVAACTWVPFGTPMSTPLWVGRADVRNPDVTLPRTGTVQPEAVISPSKVQRATSSVPVARLAPPVSASTVRDAKGSCLAYALG